jgi:hypothetical protein
LLNELVKSDATLELLHPAGHALVHYAVRFRYPGAWATRAEARTALNHAKLIRDTIRRTFGLPSASKPKRPARKRGAPKRKNKPVKRNYR